jgi:hypothetical protein
MSAKDDRIGAVQPFAALLHAFYNSKLAGTAALACPVR